MLLCGDAVRQPSPVSSGRFTSAAVGSAGHGNCCCYATKEKPIQRTILANSGNGSQLRAPAWYAQRRLQTCRAAAEDGAVMTHGGCSGAAPLAGVRSFALAVGLIVHRLKV